MINILRVEPVDPGDNAQCQMTWGPEDFSRTSWCPRRASKHLFYDNDTHAFFCDEHCRMMEEAVKEGRVRV